MMSARFIICFLRSLEKDYEKANGKFLMQLGECVARFRLDKLTQDFLIVKRIYKKHLEAT